MIYGVESSRESHLRWASDGNQTGICQINCFSPLFQKTCLQTTFSKFKQASFVNDFDVLSLFCKVEKTKHYLLLREKLESTLLMGQESLLSCVTEELSESPQPAEVDQEVSSSSEITTERQKELAAKVSHQTQ